MSDHISGNTSDNIADQVKQPADLTNQTLSGRYRLLECVGKGAMGAVYRAEHTLMRKTVAIKLLHGPMLENKDILERFQREAQAAAHIDHPNVCAATDFGKTDDGAAFFLVMEFLSGRTVKDLIKEEGPVPAPRVVNMGLQMAAALARAHKLGIVHRDLKPDNIFLITKDDVPDFVKIVDFGIARVRLGDEQQAAQLTQAGMIYGTPQYMSPEQANGEAVDLRSDLYSIGVVLYEMLVGRPPFDGTNLMQLLWKHVSDPPPPMASLAPSNVEIPPSLEAVVLKLLSKSPDDRYQRAEELADALWSLNLHSRASAQAMFSLSGVNAVVNPDDTPALARTLPPTSVPTTLSNVPTMPLPASAGAAQAKTPAQVAAEKAKNFFQTVAKPAAQKAWKGFRALPPKVQAGVAGGLAFILLLWIVWPSADDPPPPSEPTTNGSSAEVTAAPPPPTVAPPVTIQAVDVITPAGKQVSFSYKDLLEIQEVKWAYEDVQANKDKAKLENLLRVLEPHRATNLAAYALAAEAHALRGKDEDAWTTYAELLKLYPQALDDVRVIDTLIAMLSRKGGDRYNSEKYRTLIAQFMRDHKGDRVNDILLNVATLSEYTHTRKHARELLDNLAILPTLPDWAKFAIELRSISNNGSDCPKRRVLIDRLAEIGNPKAIPVILVYANAPRDQCGGGLFEDGGDCHKCMRPNLAYALSKLEAIEAGKPVPERPADLSTP